MDCGKQAYYNAAEDGPGQVFYRLVPGQAGFVPVLYCRPCLNRAYEEAIRAPATA